MKSVEFLPLLLMVLMSVRVGKTILPFKICVISDSHSLSWTTILWLLLLFVVYTQILGWI